MASTRVKSTGKKGVESSVVSPWMASLPRFMALGVLLLFLLIRWGFRDIPIERDEGSYAYMGHLLLQGGVPYLDFYEMKPPALFYSYALLSLLSGGDLAWMHVWMAVLLTLGGWLLFGLVRRWLDEGAAAVAVLAWAALGMTAYASGFSIQAEHMVAFFAIAGFWALTRGLQEQRAGFAVLAGVLLCYGLLIKQNGLFFALAAIGMIPAYHWTEKSTAPLRAVIRDGGWLALGALIPLTVFTALMALQGALDDFWFWNVEYARSYSSTITWDLGRQLLENGLKTMVGELPWFWYPGAAGALLLWFTPLAGWKKGMVTALLLAAAASVTPGLRFYGHYFLHFFPALAIGVAASVYALSHWLKPLTGPSARFWMSPLVLLVLLGMTIGRQEGYYFRPQFTNILRTVYGGNPFPESKQLANYLQTRYQKGDGLLVLGSEPQIYAYLNAESPTRHHFMAFLVKNHPREKEWQQEVIRDVESNLPRFAVWVQNPLTWLPRPNADQMIIDWGWQLIRRQYRPIAWYDQTGGPRVTVAEGDAAATYEPRGQNYLILLERQSFPE